MSIHFLYEFSLKMISLSMIVSLLYPKVLHSHQILIQHLWIVVERKMHTMDDEPVPWRINGVVKQVTNKVADECLW